MSERADQTPHHTAFIRGLPFNRIRIRRSSICSSFCSRIALFLYFLFLLLFYYLFFFYSIIYSSFIHRFLRYSSDDAYDSQSSNLNSQKLAYSVLNPQSRTISVCAMSWPSSALLVLPTAVHRFTQLPQVLQNLRFTVAVFSHDRGADNDNVDSRHFCL